MSIGFGHQIIFLVSVFRIFCFNRDVRIYFHFSNWDDSEFFSKTEVTLTARGKKRKRTQTYSIVPKSPPALLRTTAHWDHTQILDLNCSCQVLLKYSLHQSKNHYLNELSLSLPYCLRAPRVIHTLVWETRDLLSQLYANSILYLGKRNLFKQAFSSK